MLASVVIALFLFLDGCAALHVLVVGPTGGLGQHVVKEALAAGHTVSVLTRGARPLPFAADVLTRIHTHRGSGENRDHVRAACGAGVTVVISAAPANPAIAQVLGEDCKVLQCC